MTESIAGTSSGRGRLLVVGTPIGNLGDLSPRAAEALRNADLVVAEDTRLAARLLAHLDVRRPTISFNDHNASSRLPQLLDRLAAGNTLALTTDAGMPGVSDPGASLVAAAREAGATIEVVPGPSAVTAAVALAGVEAPGFVFGGFLPARPPAGRKDTLERLLVAARATALPLVLFEAPHRVRRLLAELAAREPAARVALGRELTKRHEEVLVGPPAALSERLDEPRGEFVVVVSNLATREEPLAELDATSVAAAASEAGLSDRGIVDLLRRAGVGRREAYRIARRLSVDAPDADLT
jgi:16S rRNA (cytidine1402-2'-O)-methyltransferase